MHNAYLNTLSIYLISVLLFLTMHVILEWLFMSVKDKIFKKLGSSIILLIFIIRKITSSLLHFLTFEITFIFVIDVCSIGAEQMKLACSDVIKACNEKHQEK